MASALDGLHERLPEEPAVVGVIGLSYVGRPPAPVFAEAGCRAIDFDTAPAKALGAGHSYLRDVLSERVAALVSTERLTATADCGRLGECDALVVCVSISISRPHRSVPRFCGWRRPC